MSKVAIFPIVNITTSFVAEEDTVKRIADESQANDLEKGSVKINETEEQTPEDAKVEKLDTSGPENEPKEFEKECGMFPYPKSSDG